MYRFYNPNPVGRTVGDCSIRAVSKALELDWETAYLMAALKGCQMRDMQNSNAVLDALLRQNGFYREVIPNSCPDCYTVKDFATDHPNGTYVLGTGSHVVTVMDGDYYDTWDSGKEVPVYYWYKSEE